MSDPSAANMMESTLLSQCLDFSKQLISKSPFKFEVSLASGFSFKINNFKDQENTQSRREVVRKKSPSALRRNAARKKKFVEEKKNTNSTQQLSPGYLECDLCDYKASCIVSLRKHTHKEHAGIPQVDGLMEEFTCDKETQSESNESKEISTQTELKDLIEAEKFIKIEAVKVEGSRLTAIRGGPRGLKCDHCRFETNFIDNLSIHMSSIHNTSLPPRILPTIENGCAYCNSRFKTIYNSKQHLCWGLVIAGEKKYQ